MGIHAAENRTITISKLLPHHVAIARAKALGVRNAEIAMRFGLTESWVTQITNSPLFQAEVMRLQSQLEAGTLDVGAQLEAMLPQALDVVCEDLYQPERTPHRTKVAFEVLGMRGWSKQKEPKEQGDNFNVIYYAPMPGENPEDVKKRLSEVKRTICEKQTIDDAAELGVEDPLGALRASEASSPEEHRVSDCQDQTEASSSGSQTQGHSGKVGLDDPGSFVDPGSSIDVEFSVRDLIDE